MSVIVALATGETYRNDDADGTQIAYKILDRGSLAIIVKPADGDLMILREFSPEGYAWVEGKRFLGDAERLPGADGIVLFGQPRSRTSGQAKQEKGTAAASSDAVDPSAD